MESKEIENIKLLVMEIIGYANGVMVDKVDTKMHRYFNEKASEVNNKIDEALKELQPLERISEEKYPICTYCNNTTDGEEDEKGVPICESCIIQKAEEKAREDIKSLEPLQNGEREDWESRIEKGPCAWDKLKIDGEEVYKSEIVIDFIKDLLSQSKKEGDIASDFLYWHPIGGGFPDQSIKIGVAFEPCSGCYEDFGFIIEKDGKRISAGISLKDAISKARMELESLTNQKKDI